jgi:hypothetical protein
MNQHLNDLVEFHDRYRDVLVKQQAKAFDMGAAYTKVVMGLGYGGFFTAWSFTRDHLGKRESIVVALLITVSLIAFVMYEVWSLYLITVQQLKDLDRLIAARTIEQLQAEEQALEKSAIKRKKLIIFVWRPTYVFCVVTGLLGAAVLVRRFVLELLWSK